MSSFPSIRIEGGLLGPELLDQVIAADVPGQKPADFGLEPKRNLTDEIAAAFADSRALWGVFKNRLARLPEDDLATTVTRDQWALPFFALLGYRNGSRLAHNATGVPPTSRQPTEPLRSVAVTAISTMSRRCTGQIHQRTTAHAKHIHRGAPDVMRIGLAAHVSRHPFVSCAQVSRKSRKCSQMRFYVKCRRRHSNPTGNWLYFPTVGKTPQSCRQA